MADSRSDMVMRLVHVNNSPPMLAESTLECDTEKNDPFMKGFKAATGSELGNFFEVTTFNFGVNVVDEDTTKQEVQGGVSNASGSGAATSKVAGRVQGAFASWRSATKENAKKIVYTFRFENFSFERQLDAASTDLFEACCASRPFESATLVKRVSISDASIPRGFFIMEFQNVLITSLTWDDGDLLREKCSFVCRSFTTKYRLQNPDGSLNAAVEASWHYQRDERPS